MPRKKNYRKKRSNFNKTQGPGIGKLMPLPKRFRFATRYLESKVSIDPQTGGTPASAAFRLNGLFDPRVGVGGHQPIGFDQMMPMYEHFTVIGARVRVTATNEDTTTPQNLYLICNNSTSSMTSVGDIEAEVERGAARWCQLASANSGADTRNLTYNWSAKTWFGHNPLDDDLMKGTSSSDPTKQAILHVVAAPHSVTNTSPVVCSVLIEYIAILTEPKRLAPS